MPDAWDTTVASRVHANERHRSLFEAHVRSSVPVPLPAPAVQELARGFAMRNTSPGDDRRHHNWLIGLLADPLVEVLPLGRAGAVLAGRLLALLPHPPTGGNRRRGTRAQQRAAWALDAQIAASAFAGGYGILTENVHDFRVLRDAIAKLVPGVPPLAVSDARESPGAPA